MTEPTNAVLSERINQLTKSFYKHRDESKHDLKTMEEKVDRTREIANEVNLSMRYVKESVDKMDNVMGTFIGVVNKQNEKIDVFVSTDSKLTEKRKFLVSVLQVASGIVIAVISMWGAGKL